MSDFNKQMQEAMKQGEKLTNTWMETQKQLADNYMEIMQTMMGAGMSATTSGGKDSLEGERKKALSIMEDSVNKGLDLQAELTRMYMQNAVMAMRLPEPLMTGAKQYQEMVKSVTASQKNLTHMFFEMARTYGNAGSMESWQKNGQQVADAWQDAAKKVADAQTQVAKSAADAGKKTIDATTEAGKKTAKAAR